MIEKVAFTMYPAEDINRAMDFYEQMLGLKVSTIFDHDDKKWVEYDLPGGGCFAITDIATGVKSSADSGGSIAFEVKDLDIMVEKLKSEGVKFKLDSFATEVCKMAVILDSEGNALTLHQLKNKK